MQLENHSRFANLSNADLLIMLCGSAGRTLAKQPLTELFGFKKPCQDSLFANEDRVPYLAHPQIAAAKELFVRAMHADMEQSSIELSSPEAVQAFLCGRLGGLEYEVFWCLFLDSQNRLISAEELFRGTLSQTAVYPREVVKAALRNNAHSVLFCHNHPSGCAKQSAADEMLTRSLKDALATVDVKVLDHFIVAANKIVSFAKQGLL